MLGLGKMSKAFAVRVCVAVAHIVWMVSYLSDAEMEDFQSVGEDMMNG